MLFNNIGSRMFWRAAFLTICLNYAIKIWPKMLKRRIGSPLRQLFEFTVTFECNEGESADFFLQ